MICPICKSEIKEDSKFCAKCGKQIPRCPTCNKVINKKMRFCINDGTPLPEEIFIGLSDIQEIASIKSETSVKSESEKHYSETVDSKSINAVSELFPNTTTTNNNNSQHYCVRCGAPCSDTQVLCLECQKKVISNLTEKASSKKKRILPFLFALVFICLVGFLGYLVVSGNITLEMFMKNTANGTASETDTDEKTVIDRSVTDEEENVEESALSLSSDSKLYQKNYYDPNGVLVYYDSYAYYDNGLLCSTTLHSVNYMSNGSSYIGNEYTFLYLYDENWNLTDTVLDALTISEWYNENTGEIILGYEYDANGNSSKVCIYPKNENIEQEKFGVDASKTEEVYGNAPIITTDLSSGWATTYLNEIFAGEEPTDMTSCRLIYVDNNSIPELWIDYGYGAAGEEVYTQSNDGTDSIYISQGGAEWIENENLLLTSGGHMDAYYDKVYKIEDGKFVLLGAGDYGSIDNSSVQYDEQDNPIYDYYWNDSVVSKDEYEQNLNNIFDGTRATNVYQNIYTYDQCKRLLHLLSSNDTISTSE